MVNICSSDAEGNMAQTINADLGIGHDAVNLCDEEGPSDLRYWLPLEPDAIELTNRLWNKLLRPATVPQSVEDLILEQAMARAALWQAFQRHRQTLEFGEAGVEVDLILGSGGALSRSPRPLQAALILLDIFQPVGLTRLGLDAAEILPQVGQLLLEYPSIGRQILAKDGYLSLGSCFAPAVVGREGQIAARINLKYSDGREVEKELVSGRVICLPLGAREKAALEVQFPKKRFRRSKSAAFEVSGGLVGLIIDARGRPLSLPGRKPDRVALMGGWFEDVAAYPSLERKV